MRKLIHSSQYDDVSVFLRKTHISDTTVINALRTCYTALKLNGLWGKIKVFYPMVGGTSGTMKFDLVKKNNNAFNINFTGTAVFDNNGYKPDGITGSGDSNFSPAANMTLGNEGYTICVGTNDADTKSDPVILGSYTGGRPGFSLITVRTTGTNFTARINGTTRTVANSTKLGVYSASRLSDTLIMHKNAMQVLSSTTDGPLPISSIYIGGISSYLPSNTPQRIQTVVFHEGLTNLETQTLHSIINTFELALGRKTW